MIPRIEYGPCPICQDYHDRYIAAYPDRARVIGREWDQHIMKHPAGRKIPYAPTSDRPPRPTTPTEKG